MPLTLIEKSDGFDSRREITGEVVTIGRKGTIVPTVGIQAISRIHATINKVEDGWIVSDGDGHDVSRNGIYDRTGARISESAKILNGGDYIDLVPPRDDLVCRLILEDHRPATNGSKDTKGWDYVASDEFVEDIQEIKGRLVSLEAETSYLRTDVLDLRKVNAQQDQMILKSRRLIFIVGAIVSVILAVAIGNDKYREPLTYVAASIIVSVLGSYGFMASPQISKKQE